MVTILIVSFGGLIVFSFFSVVLLNKLVIRAQERSQISDYEWYRRQYIETGDIESLFKMEKEVED